MTLQQLALQGRYATYSTMAASIPNKIFDIRKDFIKECFSDFQNVEHRLEYVTNVHGIEFINDSRATNVNATLFSLECMTKSVICILGGKDKNPEYEILTFLVKQKVKTIICLSETNEDNESIFKVFSKIVPTIIKSFSMKEAVKIAYHLGQEGDVVLLSPASSSFSMFKNYADRGRQFKNAVREL